MEIKFGILYRNPTTDSIRSEKNVMLKEKGHPDTGNHARITYSCRRYSPGKLSHALCSKCDLYIVFPISS